MILRQELDRITDELDCTLHSSMISEIEDFHTIKVIESDRPIGRYTCFMYALELYDQKPYVDIAMLPDVNVFASPDFICYLIETRALVEEKESKPGDIAIYFKDSLPTHAGIVSKTQRVISKWGTGHLYDHEIFETPNKYGNEVRYYQPLLETVVLNHFINYAKTEGIDYVP